LIEIILKNLLPFFPEIIIIGNEPASYEKLGYKVYADLYDNKGPVGGIYTALHYSAYENIYILGCDIPFMDMRIARFLLGKLDGKDSAVPRINGYLQPMAAAYHKRCLPRLEYSLLTDRLKLTRLFEEELDAVIIEEKELACYGKLDELFLNVNDQNTLQTAEQIAERLKKSENDQNILQKAEQIVGRLKKSEDNVKMNI
jgi:molybdopterin-guanine dinucleotide biosynthesis protein A